MDKPKTVRVRIAVAVNEEGGWCSAGWLTRRLEYDREASELAMDGVAGFHIGLHWLEADIPTPESTTQTVEAIDGGVHHEPS